MKTMEAQLAAAVLPSWSLCLAVVRTALFKYKPAMVLRMVAEKPRPLGL